MTKKGFVFFPIIVIITTIVSLVYFIYQGIQPGNGSGNSELQDKFSGPVLNGALDNPSQNKRQGTVVNGCNATLDTSNSRKIALVGQKCSFVFLDDSGKEKFSFTYPKEWESGLVGAAGVNVRLINNNGNILYLYQTTTDLSLEHIDKAKLCYEGCDPIVEPDEKVLSKTVETYDSKKGLKLITTLENNKLERLFLLTDQRDDDGNLLLVFEFSPSDFQYESEVIEILKSLRLSE